MTCTAQELVLARHGDAWDDPYMSWMESLMCWFKPSHWREFRAHKAAERSQTVAVERPADPVPPDEARPAESADRVEDGQ